MLKKIKFITQSDFDALVTAGTVEEGVDYRIVDKGLSDVQVNGVSKVVNRVADLALTDFSLTATATELNYCDGVTSNIQTQIDNKCQYVAVTEAPTSLAANTLAIVYED